ncbi:S8 family peptidase [Anaerosporobacter sp.]
MKMKLTTTFLIACIFTQSVNLSFPKTVQAASSSEFTGTLSISEYNLDNELFNSSENNSTHKNKKEQKFNKKVHTKKAKEKSIKNTSNNNEWNMQSINTDNVSTYNTASNKIKVAIIDSGIDYTEDIDVTERKNFIPEQDDTSIIYEDLTGHGTAIAGILTAKNNDIGITGINPNIELYSARVLDETNSAPTSRVVDAIDWAIEKNVNIISISFGIDSDADNLKDAIQRAYNAGILIIAAAGNDGNVEYPAAYDEVIAVGSVNSNGEISPSSSKGEEIEIVAPGELVKSTGAFGGEVVSSGTSMAVPHVVGVASLLWEKDPSVSSDFIRCLIDYSANLYGDPLMYGNGLIDYEYALNIYDDFKNVYYQSSNLSNSITEAEEDSILTPNTNPIDSFNDIDYVEGSWVGDDHIYTVTNATTSTSLTSTGIAIIKKGCVYQDYDSSGLSGMTSNPLWHGYWCRQYSDGSYEYSSNYLSGYMYLTRLAIAGGDNSSVSFPPSASTKDSASMVGKVTTSSINGVAWTNSKILGTTYTNNKTNRKYFLWGMAIHTATDLYAHSAYYKNSSGSWVYMSHDDDLADNRAAQSKRYESAKAVACNIISNAESDTYGSISDFALSSTYYDGSYVLRNLCRYAEVADPSNYSSKKSYLQKADYAYNGG